MTIDSTILPKGQARHATVSPRCQRKPQRVRLLLYTVAGEALVVSLLFRLSNVPKFHYDYRNDLRWGRQRATGEKTDRYCRADAAE